MLINELKAENFELKQRDKDYASLHGRVVDTEHRCTLMREEKEKLEYDMRQRAEADSSSMAKLQEDNKYQRQLLEDKDAYLARLRAELDKFRTENDQRTVEISNLTAELNTKADMGARLRSDTDELNHRLVSVEQESNRLATADLRRANDDLRLTNVNLAESNNYWKTNEANLIMSMRACEDLNNIYSGKDLELRDYHSKLASQDDELRVTRSNLSKTAGDAEHWSKRHE